MPRYRMLIEYDGQPFCGWQVQVGQPSVQEAVQDALEVVLRLRPDVVGSGRTDAGVHARGQVAHFDVPEEIDVSRLRRSLNGLLPPAVSVVALEETRPDFHARYEARMRRYHYYASIVPAALERDRRWLLRPVPDLDRMNEAAALLRGRHDFDSFCRTRSETTNRVCHVYRAEWLPDDVPVQHPARSWRFEIVADRFLHGMVRAIVGTLVEIGRGRWPVDAVSSMLAARDRRAAGPAAPPHGLVLEQVVYDREFAPSSYDAVRR